MTPRNRIIIPAVASLPPGWTLVPSSFAETHEHLRSPDPSVSFHVLGNATNVTQLHDTQRYPPAIRYPQEENAHDHAASAHNESHHRVLNMSHHRSHQSSSAMASKSRDLPDKRSEISAHVHHQSEGVYLVAQATSGGRPQMIPPPPPPESSQALSTVTVPSVPFDAVSRAGSPITVWHVCGVCHQPRSRSYHRRHPVHAGDVPLASICHKCKPSTHKPSTDAHEHVVAARARENAFAPLPRVEEVETDADEEIVVTRVREKVFAPAPRVEEVEPEEVSVVRSKVSREDYLSDWMENSTPRTAEPQTHVKVRTRVYIDDDATSAAHISSKAPTSSKYTRSSANTIKAPVPEPVSPRSAIASAQASTHDESMTSWFEISRPASSVVPPSSAATTMNSSRVREIAQAEIQRIRGTAVSVVQTDVAQLPVIAGGVTPSEVRRIVGEETMKTTANSTATPQVPDHVSSQSSSITPSEVRRIARQEIKSYRGAERAMEKHPNPYAHVRLVEDVEASQVSVRGSDIHSMLDAPEAIPRNKQEFVPRSTANETGSGREYFYVSRTAEVTSNPPSPPARQPRAAPPDMEHNGRTWPKDTMNRHQSVGYYYDDPVEERSWFGGTVSPDSSISQNRDPVRRQAPPKQGHSSGRVVQTDELDHFYQPRQSTSGLSKEVNIGGTLDTQSAADKGKAKIKSQSTPGPGRSGEEFSDEEFILATRYLSDQKEAQRRAQKAAAPSSRHDADVAQERQPYPSRQTFVNEESRLAYSTAKLPGPTPKTSLAVIQETFGRESSVSPPGSMDSDLTVWPGHVPRQARRIPLDSVAMHKQRFGADKGNEGRPKTHGAGVSALYNVPRDNNVRDQPVPPRREDIIREDRRVYHERSPSADRIVRERLVRVARDSPPDRQDHFRQSHGKPAPGHYASRIEEDDRFEEPSQRPRGILRPGNSPPSPGGGFYRNARVTFASKDSIVPTPVGFDGSRSAGFVESEYSDDVSVDSHVERGRVVNRGEQIQHYMPNMHNVPSRPLSALSESPSRESVEELARKAEKKKRVQVRVLTDAHGPYGGEVSPSSSMEALDNESSHVGQSGPSDAGVGRSKPKGGATDYKLTGTVEASRQRPLEPGWLRVTKVKKYIDADGRPYEVVSEEIVLDEDYDARR